MWQFVAGLIIGWCAASIYLWFAHESAKHRGRKQRIQQGDYDL